MKKITALLLPLFFLTACPKEKEVKEMMEQLAERRTTTMEVVDKGDYSLENLLKVQEYFFDFSEKVHLTVVEPSALKDIQKLIEKKGAKSFCDSFVLPTSYWETLNAYCSQGSFYRCSPEIHSYRSTLDRLKELVASNPKASLKREKGCN